MIFGKFMVGLNNTKVVKEKSHRQVRLPLWFPGLELIYFEQWMACK